MSGFALKLIAIVTMTIDHVGFLFFPQQQIWRLVGRIAFPIFALGVAEGAHHTSNRSRYMTRLLLWAVVAELPYDLMGSAVLFSLARQNVYWTLAAGLACCWLMEQKSVKGCALILMIMLAVELFSTDYISIGVIAIMIMYYYIGEGNRVQGALLACLTMGLFLGRTQLFCLMAVVPIALYNGKQGTTRLKHLFYAYYPVHMLVLWVLYGII